jgi:hypothetical protein
MGWENGPDPHVRFQVRHATWFSKVRLLQTIRSLPQSHEVWRRILFPEVCRPRPYLPKPTRGHENSGSVGGLTAPLERGVAEQTA